MSLLTRGSKEEMNDMANPDNPQRADAYVGKSLAEVQQLHNEVRVMGVGKVRFMGTADYRLSRLNVELSGDNVRFTKSKIKIGDLEYTDSKPREEDLPSALVTRAWFG